MRTLLHSPRLLPHVRLARMSDNFGERRDSVSDVEINSALGTVEGNVEEEETFNVEGNVEETLVIMEVTNEEGNVAEIHSEEEETFNDNEDFVEISFNAIFIKSMGSTMKIRDTLKGKSVLILVDSGSTHNFILERLIAEISLPEEKILHLWVQIGNSEIIHRYRLCKKVEIKLPGLNIVDEFDLFSLKGAEVILGIKWLVSLNTIQANWNKMFLIFNINGKQYKLQGVPKSESQEIALQSFIAQEETRQTEVTILKPIQNILQDYAGIFEEPTSLPRFRAHSHSIPLIVVENPPNIRPYRYPHIQKK